MEQFVNTFLNTPVYILIAIGLVLTIILAKKMKRMIRKLSGIFFTIITLIKIIYMWK